LITGAFLGAIYDCVRILRCILGIEYYTKPVRLKLKKSKKERGGKISKIKENTVMLITDIIFFVFCGIFLSIIVYYVNSGIVRWYILAFCLIGFAVYYFTVGKLVISVSNIIAGVIREIISCVIYLLLFPFKPVVPMTKKLFLTVKGKLIAKNRQKKAENTREVMLSIGR
jgi:hypothetical protein